MNNQKELWNKKHAARTHASMEGRPQEFAVSIAPQLRKGMKLLELGCGVGSDAIYFGGLGVDVTSTDFSDEVIAQNNAKNTLANVRFEVADMSEPLPYDAGSFDVVYAHLSLHYYNEALTDAVFAEISHVLRPKGMLYFSCKSVDDPLYGEGVEVEPGVFELNGHIRHFFSREYTQRALSNRYHIIKLEEVESSYDGFASAFMQCWAEKV